MTLKVEIPTKKLQYAFRTVKKVFVHGVMADKNTGHEVLFDASGDGANVVMEAANQGVYIRVNLGADIAKAGKLVMNSDYLNTIRWAGETTSFNHKKDAGEVSFISGRLKGKISVSQEFDLVENQRPIKLPKTKNRVPCRILKNGISLTSFTPSVQDPILYVRVLIKGHHLIVSTNDNFRAIFFKTKLTEKAKKELSFIVPSDFLSDVLESIENASIVKMGAESGVLRILADNIDVCHPTYQPAEEDAIVEDMEAHLEQMTNEKPASVITFDCAATLKMVEGVSSIVPSGAIDSDVKLMISPDKKKKRFTCKVVSSIGDASAFIEVNSIKGKEVPVSLSAKYLLEFLFLIQKGTVEMHVWGGHIMLKSVDKDSSFVMPQLS